MRQCTSQRGSSSPSSAAPVIAPPRKLDPLPPSLAPFGSFVFRAFRFFDFDKFTGPIVDDEFLRLLGSRLSRCDSFEVRFRFRVSQFFNPV